VLHLTSPGYMCCRRSFCRIQYKRISCAGRAVAVEHRRDGRLGPKRARAADAALGVRARSRPRPQGPLSGPAETAARAPFSRGAEMRVRTPWMNAAAAAATAPWNTARCLPPSRSSQRPSSYINVYLRAYIRIVYTYIAYILIYCLYSYSIYVYCLCRRHIFNVSLSRSEWANTTTRIYYYTHYTRIISNSSAVRSAAP